ncbi:hypothetical protein [Actinocrispum sp. NPDC049592]|uniref:hypothetical protein n=1 Tax=Actinocrispum sp. NPDC049592 TaxID=3154835 RepID=UPI003415413A
MEFSEAQFNEVLGKINKGMTDLAAKIDEVPRAARAAMDHWYVPDFMGDAIEWCATKICELAKWLLNKIKEALVGVAAPICFFNRAIDWQDVRGLANGVTGQLKPEAMPAVTSWTGSGATAYKASIKPQGDAAAKIAAIADKVAQALFYCSGAGLLFYLAIALILAKFIAAMVVGIAAFSSAVFSWAGAALVVEEAGVNSAMIWSAIVALSGVLVVQAQQLTIVHGETVDNSAFPRGHWPDPLSSTYGDATVKDGDADWSLNS